MQPHATTAGGFSLVFIDPPYKTMLAETIILELGKREIVSPGGLLVAESPSSGELPAEIPRFSLVDKRVYGEAGFWFYRKMNS